MVLQREMELKLSSGLQLRHATSADYDSVFAINENVYEGNDYLPEIYMEWMSDELRQCFVILSSQGDVVGFFSISNYTVDKFTVFVEQGLRLRQDVQGTSISKDVVTWIGAYARSKSSNPILLSVSCLYERTYERATSAEHKAKVEKYIAGSDNRTVLQVGLSAEFPLTNNVKAILRDEGDTLSEIDISQVYEQLKTLKISTLKLIEPFNAYILKQHWYPFLINSSFPTNIIAPSKSPVISIKSEMRVLKSQNVISIGDITPVGTNGKWIISVDIYGDRHDEFMDHLAAHFNHFEQTGRTVLDLQFHVPKIVNIEQTAFHQQLTRLKTEDKFYFTLNFVNQLKVSE